MFVENRAGASGNIGVEIAARAPGDGYTLLFGNSSTHAINPALLMNDAIDPLRPEILLYVPKDNGRLELVGVEYWKADADQSLATDGDRPSLFGRGFDGPMPGHNPQMPVHYDLHVWVAEENPSGVFALFNPALSC